MKLALATFLAVAVCAASALPAAPTGRIIGGVDALPGEFPQICLIQWVLLTQQSNICSCTILNGNHVITAGHCITEAPTAGRLEVLGGVLDTTVVAAQRQRMGVQTAFLHPGFTASPRRNDLAIVSYLLIFIKIWTCTYTITSLHHQLRLNSHFGENEWIRPATLPTLNAIPSGATMIAGWGQTGTGLFPPSATRLQKIQAPVVTWADCSASLNRFDLVLQPEFMCTGPLTGGIGVCNGDAGGPVLQNGMLLGVISYTTSPCAAVGSASVHTDVAQFIGWITDTLNRLN